jgi:transcriptional regulator with XRE-family HTH domain
MVDKIKELCDKYEISIYALEKALGLGNGTISRWDKSRPSVDKIALVARFFDKPIEYFID